MENKIKINFIAGNYEIINSIEELNKQNNLLEIRGILRTLADDDYGQTIATKKRLMELNTFLKTL